MIENLDGIHETVNYKDNTKFKLYENQLYHDYPMHWHIPIEIIYPTEGRYKVVFNNCEVILEEEDIIIICPGVIHALYAPPSGTRIIFQADCSIINQIKEIESVLSLIGPAIVINPEESPYIHRELSRLILSIKDEYESNEFLFEASIYSQLMEIFIIIGRNHLKKQSKYNTTNLKHTEYLEMFISICDYISNNCTKDIKLDDIVEMAGFSKFHFSRLFKQFTGVTFYKYLSTKRIEYAERLLIDPKITVTEVALQSGFTSLSSFNRMFKIVKSCTPTEFRNMYSNIESSGEE